MANTSSRFRWVACQLDALKKCRRKRDVLKTLEELPESLDETYQRILLNIDKKDQPEVWRALMWLAFSNSPLTVRELAEAVVIDPQSVPPFDPEERLHDPYNDIMEILGSLITIPELEPDSDSIYESKRLFESKSDSEPCGNTHSHLDNDCNESQKLSRHVGLAHFSVKEYLLSARIMDSPASKFGITAMESNYFIAECCLLYIFYYDEWVSEEKLVGATKLLPLLLYACGGWHIHTEALVHDARNQLDPLVFRLFLSETAFLAWIRIFYMDIKHENNPKFIDSKTPLYQASRMGLGRVVQLLLDKGADPNARDLEPATALYKTLWNVPVDVFRLLLKNGADINIKCIYLNTALHGATVKDNQAREYILLESGADVESRQASGWTALHQATEKSYTDIVRLLLENGTDTEVKDQNGWTALHRATDRGYTDIVRLLLENGADTEAKDQNGCTALPQAADKGYTDIVRLLLENGADVKAKDQNGCTALHQAADKGYTDIVRLLLGNGADVKAKDQNGCTALHRAAHYRDKDLVELLLENGAEVDAESDSEGRVGWTPLYLAVYYGNDATAQLLLESGADPLVKGPMGNTALDYAIKYKSEGMADLLSSYCDGVELGGPISGPLQFCTGGI
jgi:ankyrin repeat domain-containing protein 50